jgi:G3E family GTPase
MQRIPVSLITGFLGSGKTTLVNKLLRQPEGARTAVVVNEFGEVGLDHDLIEASDDSVVLLSNGCVCCAMQGDLVTALDKLFRSAQSNPKHAFERVIIETSGLVDPGPVIQLLLSAPSLTSRFQFDGVVTVVDAINGQVTLDAHLEAVKQVAVADRLLISKTDLPGADVAAKLLRERIRAINPAAPLLSRDEVLAAFCSESATPSSRSHEPSLLPTKWLRAESYSNFFPKAQNKPHDQRFHSFCFIREEPLSELALQLLLESIGENLGPNLLRIKGLVNVTEQAGRPALIQGAQKLLHGVEWLDAWPSLDQRSRIVFITLDADHELIKELVGFADRMASNTIKAQQRASQGEAQRA